VLISIPDTRFSPSYHSCLHTNHEVTANLYSTRTDTSVPASLWG